ncbi:DUF1891 domain-containing protein (plasmid) [Piscirickettsia salmonis]|nr:DUF1891 domain-containing protein [Piscirickettsia salmonis]WGZ73403.1 DUF1891 domain-containing protein [Piscirickettsia salmonis]
MKNYFILRKLKKNSLEQHLLIIFSMFYYI